MATLVSVSPVRDDGPRVEIIGKVLILYSGLIATNVVGCVSINTSSILKRFRLNPDHAGDIHSYH